MAFRIQRVPQGLNQLLSIFGGQTPVDLEDKVRGAVDLLQMYGLQQKQVFAANNAALAEGGLVQAVGTAGIVDRWAVLFGGTSTIIKTGTMTAAKLTLQLGRGGFSVNTLGLPLDLGGNCGPFGATETGPFTCSFFAPYPIILPPPWQIFTRLEILGTDATASVSTTAEIGLLA